MESIGTPIHPHLAWSALRQAGRLVLLVTGLFLFASGIVTTIQASVGLGPWDVLHQGLSRTLPLSFGQANIVVGVTIVAVSWWLGIQPRIGTLLNMLLIGVFADLLLNHGVIPAFSTAPLLVRLALHVLGIVMVGFGCGLYIKAGLGAGPRDSLMLALTRRLALRVSIVRAGIEISVVALGLLLGGVAGLGTIIFALGIGPAIEASFRLLGVHAPAPSRTTDRVHPRT